MSNDHAFRIVLVNGPYHGERRILAENLEVLELQIKNNWLIQLRENVVYSRIFYARTNETDNIGCRIYKMSEGTFWFGVPPESSNCGSGIEITEKDNSKPPPKETLDEKVKRKRNELLGGFFS